MADTILQKKNGDAVNVNMLGQAKKLAIRAYRKLDYSLTADPILYATTIYETINQKLTDNIFSKIISKHANDFESNEKQEMLKKAVSLEEYTFSPLTGISEDIKDFYNIEEYYQVADIFFLASEHDDCAQDHLDYQGKVYIDEKWARRVKDVGVREMIYSFLKTHNIKTMQWVTGDPVWFLTRPNCRHFFKQISVSDVLNNNISQLIQKYNMNTIEGDRQVMQTITHSTKAEWYQEQNVKKIIEQYEERLDLHKQLYKVKKIPLLELAIKKDKILLKKWNNYLQTM